MLSIQRRIGIRPFLRRLSVADASRPNLLATDIVAMKRRKRLFMLPWKFGYRAALSAHPKHWDVGTWLVNTGSTVQLIGFTMTDIASLRALSICSSICWVIFYLRQLRYSDAMRVPLAWVCTFLSVHVFMLVSHMLRNSDTGLRFSQEEMDLFEEHFLPSGMKPRQFKRFMDTGCWVDYPPRASLMEEDTPVTSLAIIASGRVVSYKNGMRLQALSSFPGARHLRPAGDAGAWIGDIGWLEDFSKKPQKLASLIADSQLEESHQVARRMRQTMEAQSSQLEALARESQRHHLGSKPSSKGDARAANAFAGVPASPGEGSDVRAGPRALEHRPRQRPWRDWPNPTLEPPIAMEVGKPRALYTYKAKTNVRAIVFHHTKLEALLRSDADLKAAFITAATAAVVGKIVNLSDQTALQRYRENLRAVLVTGTLQPAEKRFLREYRRRHSVSYDDHVNMLESLGWTEDEFSDGAQNVASSDEATLERAIRRRQSSLLRHDSELARFEDDAEAAADGEGGKSDLGSRNEVRDKTAKLEHGAASSGS